MRRNYVCGTAYGIKRTSGKLTEIPAYVIYVEKKASALKFDKRKFGSNMGSEI